MSRRKASKRSAVVVEDDEALHADAFLHSVDHQQRQGDVVDLVGDFDGKLVAA
jgi:hypothetical protein